ncbi:MAG: SMP-30/gluconolactonase/LRE family protein [Candidatus Marinimicrobia bacterium]|jgi:sugar lactone lactonase YvrE|nr:SMP-30/gluconolactonase/LRE family protein [Candidatus Neomarinimicrobiota bacterium]MBT3501708.1 SMP-30/gluconolactonase/LRE family protein [Candidatus Neomarinimicrobiota bacterium]MBT3839707.1 SMP-30/gluconolactonase/LRE family protein [Candidatus Neomarinimicrobiota bacterium]MBT3999093.1 SMP-30/gluconolactonase/LRE family protein [Candidatus Neomarinimicrobiota bacterium]MBT4282332.1 SMP-30/gluconolactonase/LRE family protein [Candidatus Neomarinimicrobiota bacterium]
MLKWIGKTILIIFGITILYLLTWPTGIDPVAWSPKKAPGIVGIYAHNKLLSKTQIIGKGIGVGPEDIGVDIQGRIYAPYEGGKIFRYDSDGTNGKEFVDTKGRPLGLGFDADGNLIICDSFKGLLSASPSGDLTTLVTEVDGVLLKFTDDVDIAKDGMIYFSDASIKFDQHNYKQDLLEHRPNGRVISYNPNTKKAKTIKDNMYFANGVAVSPDQSYLLVVETGDYKITKIWIAGDKKGNSEIFMDNLPGIPDGISSSGDGIFWIAFPSRRQEILEKLATKPFLRKVVMRLPEFLQPAPERYGFVIGVNEKGNVVFNLQDPSPKSYSPITSVEAHNGYLYFGSLTYNGIGRIPMP